MLFSNRNVSLHLITLTFIGSTSAHAALLDSRYEYIEMETVSTPVKHKFFAKDDLSSDEEKTPLLSANFDEEAPLYTLRGIGLFSGTDPFSSLIRTATKSNYSHVGVILSKVGVDPNDESQWICFESTGSASEILHKHELPHVRVTPWEQVIADYSGGIAFRTFEFEKDHEPSPQAITDFVKRFNGKPYQTNPFELVLAVPAINSKPDLQSVFCSELAAEMLLEHGYLKGYYANNYTPKHFSSEYPKLNLIGAKLSRETVVKHKSHIGIAY